MASAGRSSPITVCRNALASAVPKRKSAARTSARLPTCPQPCQGERRVSAGRENEVQLRGQVLQQEGHPPLNGVGGDDVVVIQHEGNITSATVHEVIREHGQHGLWWRGLRRVQHCERRCPDLCIQRLQGGNQVGEKTGGIVVLRFQREPGDRCARSQRAIGRAASFCRSLRALKRG